MIYMYCLEKAFKIYEIFKTSKSRDDKSRLAI